MCIIINVEYVKYQVKKINVIKNLYLITICKNYLLLWCPNKSLVFSEISFFPT